MQTDIEFLAALGRLSSSSYTAKLYPLGCMMDSSKTMAKQTANMELQKMKHEYRKQLLELMMEDSITWHNFVWTASGSILYFHAVESELPDTNIDLLAKLGYEYQVEE